MLQSTDMQGLIISVNEYWLTSMGYKYDEVVGTKALEYLTDDSKEYYKNKLSEIIQKGQINNFEAQAIKKNGEIIDLLISSKLLLDNTGKPSLTMTNLIDISAKKKVEIELRLSKEKQKKATVLKPNS